MIVELPIVMLACARIGAIHSVVFGAFSGDALRDRMNDCESTVLVCSDGYYRSGKTINSKDNADDALKACPSIKKVVVVKRAGNPVKMEAGVISGTMTDERPRPAKVCEPVQCDSEDPYSSSTPAAAPANQRCVTYSGRLFALHCINFQICYGLQGRRHLFLHSRYRGLPVTVTTATERWQTAQRWYCLKAFLLILIPIDSGIDRKIPRQHLLHRPTLFVP